ncbi:MAG: NPCBM/NEW2 domain-containing protein [Bacillota bacterium]|nr:NPCBM/NEW2 domain-containing protein [Bacillota bacterium]
MKKLGIRVKAINLIILLVFVITSLCAFASASSLPISDGQLALPENPNSTIVAVEAGDNHTVILRKDGTVQAIGDNEYGQCNTTKEKGFTDIIAISAGSNHTVGLKKDGTVVAVGRNDDGQCNTTKANGFSNIVSISADYVNTIGLKKDGTLAIVGSNDNGQKNVSAKNGFSNIVSIAAGPHYTYALKKDGTAVSAGSGACDTSKLSDVTEITARGDNLACLKNDKTVTTIGSNSNGQCDTTVQNGFKDICAIVASGDFVVGLKTDGTLVSRGTNINLSKQNGFSNIVAISAGNGFVVALRKDGTLVAAGNNSKGQCNVSKLTITKTIEGDKWLESITPSASARYTGNAGDSFIKVIGTRNGKIDVGGNAYQHGLEAWIARWNGTAEKSWAWNEYTLDSKYKSLSGKIVLLKSYNVKNFDTKFDVFGDGKLLYSTELKPKTLPKNININISGVKKLKIYLHDLAAVQGGTSFGLANFKVSTKTLQK